VVLVCLERLDMAALRVLEGFIPKKDGSNLSKFREFNVFIAELAFEIVEQ
jgi:hypothetical protein